MKRILLLFLSFFFLGSLTFSQTADFQDGCAPLTVNFTPPVGMSSYFWDFGDGASSTLQTPSNTYIDTGSFVVELRETVNGPLIGTITIDVFPKPVPMISITNNKGCVPLNVQFTDVTVLSPSVNVTSYSWVFEDGGTALGNSVSHTFFTAGNFWTSLELNTNLPSCNVTRQFDELINVSNRPLVGFSTNPDPPSSCAAPLTVSFTNNSSSSHPLSYQWDLGDGTSSTMINAPTTTYTMDSIYRAKLIAIDTNQCADSTIRIISVGSPTADFSFPDTVCLFNYDTLFNNSSNGNYTWDYGQDSETLLTLQGVTLLRYSSTGLKTIQLTVRVGACTGDTSINVFVEDPTAEYTSTPDYACEYPYTVSYTPIESRGIFDWDVADTNYSSRTPSYTLNAPDSVSVYHINDSILIPSRLIYTSPYGCKDTAEYVDTLFLPTALMVPDVAKGCLPLTVSFINESVYYSTDTLVKWEWFFGDGNDSTRNDGDTIQHTYTSPGHFWAYLIVTNESGCTDTSYRTLIQVGDVISPDFTVDQTNVCVGDTIHFTDITLSPQSDSIDAWHYSTEGNRMFSCFDEPNPFWVYNHETGPQDVTMTVEHNGCASSITKSNLINVDGAIAKIDYRNFCDPELDVQFNDSSIDASIIRWEFGDGDTSIQNHPLHTYDTTGDYQVILSAEKTGSSCPITYDTVLMRIRDVKADFFVDSLACLGIPHTVNADSSQDVHENCHKGYVWSFSDPLMRPLTTASSSSDIQFLTSGRTIVTLEATDINGCRDTTTQELEVFDVQASFVVDDSVVCAPADVTFTNTSTADTTMVSWRWEFGDGDTSLLENTQHTYSAFMDTNRIVLYVTDTLGCMDTARLKIPMYRPFSTVSLIDSTLCVGDSTGFRATDYTAQGSNLAFSWDFGNGDTSNLQNPFGTYITAGKYIATLTIKEIGSGCSESYSSSLRVVDYPIAAFSHTNDNFNFVCPNENVLFTNNSTTSLPSNYRWNFGNGRTSTIANPGTVYINNGDYQVQLIVTMNQPFGCADTLIKDIRVKGPSGNFVTDLMGDTICRLDSVLFTIKDTADVENYTWDFGDGSSVSNMSPISHQYTFVPPSGQTVAKLILSNADGSCPETIDTVITLYEVVADFQRNDGIDTIFCFAPLALTNQSINATNWSWDLGDGNSRNQGDQFTHQYDQPGTYNITLGVSNNQVGCTDTTTKTVTLHPIPDISVVGDTICEGDAGNLFIVNPDATATYTWTPNPMVSFISTGIGSIQTSPTTTTAFVVDVVDANGCVNQDIDTAFVINPLNLTDFDTIIVIGDVIDLPVYANAGLYNFTWTPIEGLSCLDCLPPSVQPLEKVSYNLQIEDKLACFAYDVNFDIDIHPETFIKMPTTFTPNGDGINDIVFVEGWGIRELLSFQIFNRWGEVVFETRDVNQGWDGKYKGKIQNSDVYVYKIRVNTWRDEEKQLEGYLNLSR